MKPAIIIYGVSDVSVQAIADAAHNLGYQPVFLFSRHDYYDTNVLFNIMSNYAIEYSTEEDVHKITRELMLMYNVLGVISSKDEFIELSIRLANAHGLNSVSESSILANDKQFIAERFPDLCPPTIDLSAASDREISDFTDSCEEMIIKPKRGTDSIGVSFIDKGTPLPNYRKNLILQKYIKGRNVLIDGAVLNGEIVFWGVSEVARKIQDTEMRYDLPVWDIMSTNAYEIMKHGVAEICKSLGITKSFFHVQYILGEDNNPKIIDPNFGRVGGSGFSMLLSSALGIGHQEFWEGYIKIVTEGVLDKRFYNPLSEEKKSVINFGIDRDDLVTSLEYPHDGHVDHYILKKLPSPLSSVFENNAGWIGAAVGPTKLAEEYVSRIRAITSSGVSPVIF